MKAQGRKEGETSRSLLASASVIFAQKGYHDATIADICEQAGVNIAAVNYHFGNKETLYREAWLHAFRASVKAHPPDGGVSPDAPAEGRLRGYIESTLRRATDKNNMEIRIMMKEMPSPTGLLEVVAHEALLPLHMLIEDIVRELIGPSAQDMQVRFCTMSIINQCLNPVVVRAGIPEDNDTRAVMLKIGNIKAYARHVYRFSLAGIYAYRDYNQKNFIA
jgi:AcrR family transcriptional regulator